MLCTALLAIPFLLSSYAIAQSQGTDNSNSAWGWPALTPATGYINTTFPVQNGTKAFAYIDETYNASKIERAIIQIHGSGRDCWNYAKHTSDARTLATQTLGLDPSTILSIAPEMFAVGDMHAGAFSPSDEYLCWLGDEWSGGADNVEACTPGVKGVSAFTAIDAIVAWLQNTTMFPSLNTIVVSGHSFGGQFTQRYSSLGSNRGNDQVEMHYWVGNPASYLYLNDARPSPIEALQACADYDTFKYGMKEIGAGQSYASPAPTASQIWATYIANNVHLALGLADSGSGDLGCEGLVQGQSHLERGQGFMNYVQQWAGSLPSAHTVDYFPGIRHNAGKMLQQPTSLHRLFFDRGTNITTSQAPAGMTNGVKFDFVSPQQSLLTLHNFTHVLTTTSALSSKVNVFAYNTSTTIQTSPNSTSSAQQAAVTKSSSHADAGNTVLAPLSLLLAFALVTVFCIHQ
ncbi:hypothetical protein CBS101457_005101 [Exobasidium rhododendri]|nr:hypothetical protein CBS101457_005101 [Exobasidium rhododendri]